MTSNPFHSKSSDRPNRVLIIEEALRSPKGHWPEYIRTIADACRAEGDDVTVVAHSEAAPEVVEELQATPFLRHSAWDGIYDSSNPVVRYGGALLHNYRLYKSMAEFFDKNGKFDCVLAPTILIHHLLAWGKLARRFAGRKFDRLTLIFVNGQGIYQGPGKPVLFPSHPKRTVFKKGLQAFRPLIESGQVVLGAETEAMAEEYEAFADLPFQRFCHPVEFGGTVTAKTPSAQPVFSCFGFARHEKGSDLLQDAILAVRQRRPDLKIKFVIQWLDDFRGTDGQFVTRHPALIADPGVDFITQPIGPNRYMEELRRTTAMLLPYRASSYYSRVSRVAIEAAIMGIPLLYTRQTWLEEMVESCGAGVGFENENLEDLINQIIYLAENIGSLKRRAEERSDCARRTHSAAAFRKVLLDFKAREATSPAGSTEFFPAGMRQPS